ncbi:Hypothetical protein, putative [Bodo saltans]|uniref:Uncharacterized protein n=1 Tax=Bodo saltans TaxID=75058 RepID=A0A0S4JD22_BODSA|nr:Hypothetical protein, putative [Bodo saltans]|eukprot:CUG87925.1 Hypothetical protein, putative [Bodo saltans]
MESEKGECYDLPQVTSPPVRPTAAPPRKRPSIVQPDMAQLDLTDAPPHIRAALLEKLLRGGGAHVDNVSSVSVSTPRSPGHSESLFALDDASREDGSPTTTTTSSIRQPSAFQQLPRPKRSFTIVTSNSSTKSMSEAEISALMCRYFSVRDEAATTTSTTTFTTATSVLQ